MIHKRMFDVECTDCGKSTTVPFEPNKSKPVYCKACFSKHRINQRERTGVIKRFMQNAWAIRRDDWQGRKEEHRSIFQKP